jgi:hypothetical protein
MNQNVVVVKDFDNKSDFDEVEGVLWNKSAKWQFNRLQLGRKNADQLIELEKQTLIQALPADQQIVLNDVQASKYDIAVIMKPIISEAVNIIFERAWDVPLRPLQYIINTKKNAITAVCTRNHSLLDPVLVGDTVRGALKERGFTISDVLHKNYAGVVGTNKIVESPFGKLKVGISIGFGKWDTTRAILGGVYFELDVCTNPLAPLELSNTMGAKLAIFNQKVLRLGRADDILKRVRGVVDDAMAEFQYDGMPPIMIQNGKLELAPKDATVVVNAMSNAYGIGKKVRTEILDGYSAKSPTVWNLAMIISKIATDDENFRKDAVRTPAKLSAIALVLLTTSEMPKVITNSYSYCQSHEIEIPA